MTRVEERPMLQLIVEHDGALSATRLFETDEVIVGRSDRADLSVDDSSVSRRQARFFRQGNEWLVEDLESRNGTELNGRRLTAATVVHPGDVVRVGSMRLCLSTETAVTHPEATAGPTTDDGSVFSVLRPAADLMHQVGAAGDAKAAVRLRLLNDVHRALAAPIERTALLQMLLDQACAVLQPEQAAIFMRTPDGRLERVASRQSPGEAGSMLVSHRLAEEVTVKGSAALVLDAQSDERFADAKSVVASGVRSILAAPLTDADGCLGMIALYSSIHVKRFSEQDLEVLVSIASAAAMRIRNIDLAEAAAERRALDREIALARDIQMDLLRRRPPERAEVELAGHVIPARSVGGDFYDFLIVGDALWFVVADVSGKGIGAALMMAVGQTLFRSGASSRNALGEAMAAINHELATDNDRAMFVTALAGRLDLASGRLQVANAGHNLPYLLQCDGTVKPLAVRNSVALGVVEDAAYPVTDVPFGLGDAILLYTDGVCDAINTQGRAFGTAGLEQTLDDIATLPADVIVHRICDAVTHFAGPTAQEDDITVAVVRYRGTARP